MTVAEELWGAETRKAVENFPVSLLWLMLVGYAVSSCALTG